MGILHQSGNKPGYVPRYNGLQIQTSTAAAPINIVYGTNRCAPNAIWTNGFFAIPQYSKNSGKGGGGNQLISYKYYTSFLLGICEGPINKYGNIYSGQNIYTSFWQSIWWNTGIDFSITGTQTQIPWGYLQANFSSQALNYKGLAYVGAIAYDLGSSPILPQFSFEIYGRMAGSTLVNEKDADPALVIQDFLTNAQYGVGFPQSSIDAVSLLTPSSSMGDASLQTYCRAAGIAMSPVISNREAANSIIDRWLRLTNAAAVWSNGRLKFIPFGDSLINAAVPYMPNLSPVYNLTDRDFVYNQGNDPVQVTRTDPYSIPNWQRIQIAQRSHDYTSTPIDVWDQNHIDLYGLRMASDINASEICDHKIGQTVAQLTLQRKLYIRNTYKFKLSFEYCLLDPMDLVTITDSGLGLDNVVVRITEIEEDQNGVLAVTAEEFPGGTGTSVQYPIQSNSGNSTNLAVIPARVNPPVIFEPPSSLTNNVSQVWIAASGGIAPVYKLAETSAMGSHSAGQTLFALQKAGATISFSVYVTPVERNVVRLNFNDGMSDYGCDFDLVNVTTGVPDAWGGGQISAEIDDAGTTASGEQWYQCSISAVVPSSVTPTVSLMLKTSLGNTVSYAGTVGDGVYFWGAAFAPDGGAPSFLPAMTSAVNVTLATSGISAPSGVAGMADPSWGGCYVWLSSDNSTYGQVGQITAPARQGVLTANLAAYEGSSPDTLHTLSVDLQESGGSLESTTAIVAANAVATLCFIENELLSYQTATLTGPSPNAYGLTNLYRGLYGTNGNVSHSSGVPFVLIDGAIFKYDLIPAYIGTTIYLKFQSFNIFGGAVEDLSECYVYTYTPSGSGAPAGPIASALAAGTSLDFQLASLAVNISDDWGRASTSATIMIDFGLVSL